MTLALPHPMTIKPEDFEPPLKREKQSVPGYWTIKELANELEVSTRYINYLITGNPKTRLPPQLKAYKADSSYLIAEQDALAYIQKTRLRNKSL